MAAGQFDMTRDQIPNDREVLAVEWLELHQFEIAAPVELARRSSTYAIPPLMPAAKFRPVRPRTTTRPPVMYSQP